MLKVRSVVILTVFSACLQAQTVTVHLLDTIDSRTSTVGQTFRASVSKPANLNGATVEAGSPARVELAQGTSFGMQIFTVKLSGLVIGGQETAVNGTSPTLPVSVKTFLRQKNAEQPTPAGNVAYLPAGTDVRFVVAAANSQTSRLQTPSADRPPASSPPPSAMKQERNGISFELDKCLKEDQRIVCTVWVTNISGTDDHLFSPENTEWQFYIDNLGNRLSSSDSTLGNTPTRAGHPLLVPSLRMPLHIVFERINEQATSLVRLVIQAENRVGRFTVQFDNVALTNPDQSSGPSEQAPANRLRVTRDDVRYDLRSCERQVTKLVCRIQATNLRQTPQRLNWFTQDSYAIDEQGNRLNASSLLLGSTPLQGNSVLAAGASISITATFDGLEQSVASLPRLEIAGNDGSPVTLRYSKVLVTGARQ